MPVVHWDPAVLKGYLSDALAEGKTVLTCASPQVAKRLRWALYNYRYGPSRQLSISVAGSTVILEKRTSPMVQKL